MYRSPFFIPLSVLVLLLLFGLTHLLRFNDIYSLIIIRLAIAVGSWKLLRDTWQSITHKSFALDYIALLAIATGILTKNYIVAGVIVLMMSGGNALEDYAQVKAKESLTVLKNRLPNQVQVITKNGEVVSQLIEEVDIGTTILIRKGEVVPLDGILVDDAAILDESSLTGEANPVSRSQGERVRSGSLNSGEVIKLITTVTSKDSTYQQIVRLVEEATAVKTPFVQLADKLSGWFTLITIFMASLAFFISRDITNSLAVLVIATPCPLILATPIALVGGMNAAAKQRIIFKRLASLEVLSEVDTLIFDKTGTLTLGKPQLESLSVKDLSLNKQQVLKVAASIEKNSLHPYAVAIVDEASKQDIKPVRVDFIEEKIGTGLSGVIDKERYYLSSDPTQPDSQVVLKTDQKTIAVFRFFDKIKDSTVKVMSSLKNQGLQLYLFTGDNLERTETFIKKLSVPIQFKASLSPLEKQNEIKRLKEKARVAMIGDGINDAPALAMADVGIAFSHQQHTAASEAADVILLGSEIKSVQVSLAIARHTMIIAKQSMYIGMLLSLIGMTMALVGKLPPLMGAITQEFIDVIVILNALRAAVWKEKHV